MKKIKAISLILAGFMVFSQTAWAGDTASEESAVNTEVTDETLVVCLASEPSTLWGAPDGKVENECQIINSALMDRLVTTD